MMAVVNWCKHFVSAGERGVTIIENLVAIGLLSIVLAGSSRFIVFSMHNTQSSRAYASIVSDAQKEIDSYRSADYGDLLSKFGSTYSSISNGQTVTENSSFDDGRATFITTFTAQKTSNTAAPEAIKIKLVATQRRGGNLEPLSFTFETYLAQVQ